MLVAGVFVAVVVDAFGIGSTFANKQMARVEAGRLLRLVVVPPGSVKLTSGPSSLLTGPTMGTPMTTSLIDASAFWKVPLPMNATLSWFTKHPPGGLVQSRSGSTAIHGTTTSSGYAYDAPSSTAWTGASVEIGVAPIGPNTSVLRADGMAMWIDPVPFRDTRPGLRVRVAVASGCPAGDRGVVGVTNTLRSLERSLVPPGSPTAGLVCEYDGLNGQPFALKRTTALDRTAAGALSVKARRLPLGHVDGAVTNCPMDDASITLVALLYPGGANVDLWIETTGCTTVSNGFITAQGSVPL